LDFAAAFARIECHYFMNGIFVEDGWILQQAHLLKDIPIYIAQESHGAIQPSY
jgi:proline iminopeptidase